MGRGTVKNLERAIYWLERAIENGEVFFATYNLGQCLEYEIGVEKDAFKLFDLYKFPNNDFINANFHLGYCYVNGIRTAINKERNSNYTMMLAL